MAGGICLRLGAYLKVLLEADIVLMLRGFGESIPRENESQLHKLSPIHRGPACLQAREARWHHRSSGQSPRVPVRWSASIFHEGEEKESLKCWGSRFAVTIHSSVLTASGRLNRISGEFTSPMTPATGSQCGRGWLLIHARRVGDKQLEKEDQQSRSF